jgi:Na+/melibiose symporter-like transporter
MVIVFIFAWAIFEKNDQNSFFTLFGINFIIIGAINILFCVTHYKEKKKRAASVYFIIALSFWVLSIVYFSL